jgi:peptide deformylase
MAVRRILQIDNPDDYKILKTNCRTVQLPNPSLRQLIEDMFETMHEAGGVGLAAPQVGVLYRIAVIWIPPETETDKNGVETVVAPEQYYTLINPTIVKSGGSDMVGKEGCLSLPNWYGDVPRPAWVTVDYQDAHGRSHRIRRASGLLGRALQHEIDHLNGVLFTERIRDLSTLKEHVEENETNKLATA